MVEKVSIHIFSTHGDHMNNVEQKQNNRNKINGKMIDKSIILVLQFETLIVTSESKKQRQSTVM